MNRVVPDPRYEMLELDGDANGDELIVFLTFSGGGKRSAAFSYGVLEALRDYTLPHAGRDNRSSRLVDRVDLIAGVSGGSFTAASFGLGRHEFFRSFKEAFLYDQTEDSILGVYFLPWNWEWFFNPVYGRNDAMAEVYDERLFHGATYADLHAQGRPLIVLGATDIVLGSNFIFTQREFDLLCADLNAMPVSRAVAASAGYPGLFSPITVNSHRKNCGDAEPDWLAPMAKIDPGEFRREAIVAEGYRKYLNPEIEYLHLMDGGISDNLALRGLVNAIVLFNQIEKLPPDSEFLNVRRILVISVDGQSATDISWSKHRNILGISQIFAAVSGTQIDRYNTESLLLANEVVNDFEQHLRDLRCAHAPEIGGKPCGDVRSSFIHLTLRDIEDTELRDRLLSIPTALSIEKDQVDALIAAGRRAVDRQTEIRDLLDGL